MTDHAHVAARSRELACSSYGRRRFGVADEEPRNVMTLTSASKRRASSPTRVGELERGARRRERTVESAPEALGPGEADRNPGLEPLVRRCVAERFLEHGDGQVVVLEIGEQQEGLGAERPLVDLGEQVGGDRPRARPLSGREVCARSRQRPRVELVAQRGRRQSERLFGELRRRPAPAPRSSASARRFVEHPRDVGVGRVGAQREVPGANDRIVGDLGDPRVDATPLVPEAAVEDRRQQGMREADERSVTFDDPRREGGLERLRGDSRLLEQRLRRRADGGRDREGFPRARGKRLEPRPHELVERLRDRKRLQRFDVRGKNARDLEREERVPAGSLVDAEQRLPWKRRSQSITQEPMKRADTQWTDSDALEAVATKRMLELGLPRLVAQPLGEQNGHARSSPAAAGRRPARCDDAGSSHWTSSIATSVGRRSLSSSARRELQPRPCGSRQGRPSPPRGAAQPRARAGVGAPGRAAPRRRSARRDRRGRRTPTHARAPKVATTAPAALASRAYSTAASHSVDLPMPASPSRTSASASSPSTKARREASSASLPTISDTIDMQRA